MNQKGIATIYISLLLFALVGFVALVIDLGYMYVAKTQLQNAADAASLAAAATLDGSFSYVQSQARAEGQKYASYNKCAGEPVYMDQNPNNNAKGDLVVGYWDGSVFLPVPPSGKTCNAVKAVARRTSQAGEGISSNNKPVSIFFGRIFNVAALSASASAIAVKQPGLFVAPLVLCLESAKVGSGTFYLNKNLDSGSVYGAAWTLFDDKASVNADEVKAYLNNYGNPISDKCGGCITTNNGTMAINELEDLFRNPGFDAKHKNVSGGVVSAWQVAIIIVDGNCKGAGNGCPPYKQGGSQEPYHVWGWANVLMTDVIGKGGGNDKGFTATIVDYQPCPNGLNAIDPKKTMKLVF